MGKPGIMTKCVSPDKRSTFHRLANYETRKSIFYLLYIVCTCPNYLVSVPFNRKLHKKEKWKSPKEKKLEEKNEEQFFLIPHNFKETKAKEGNQKWLDLLSGL